MRKRLLARLVALDSELAHGVKLADFAQRHKTTAAVVRADVLALVELGACVTHTRAPGQRADTWRYPRGVHDAVFRANAPQPRPAEPMLNDRYPVY